MIQDIQVFEATDKADCAKICDDILAALPDWFGPFEVYKDYLEDLKTRPVFLARSENEIVGIMVLSNASALTDSCS